MTTASTPKRRKRPFGVNALIVVQLLALLSSVFALALYVAVATGAYEQAVLSLERQLAEPTPGDTSATVTGLPTVADLDMGIPDLAALVFELILSSVTLVGLWSMRRWAWYLVMLTLGWAMVTDLFRYYFDEPAYWSMLFSVIMVFYLNQREVQQAFARRKGAATHG